MAAQIAAGDHANQSAFSEKTKERIHRCAAERNRCPMLAPEYQDLTGDGKSELIVGFGLEESNMALWVYRLDHGAVARILDTAGKPLFVEVANGKLVVREPMAIPGYEMRTVFSWDGRRQVMDLQTLDYVRTSPAASTEPTP
ncbi:hypothetical protein [Streptomyces coffeae]|uniref:hypothetical protein n=1 Tax=Streptomyces coffeae TaxID=621382 RepID=UPI0027DBE222|nr:hypothetical protein [Streptomyces coffeae]